MNGNSILLDTNIILYLMKGDKTLIPLLEDKNLYVSFITELELLSYSSLTPDDAINIRLFLNECIIVDITPQIKAETIRIRKTFHLKLPDCIILATAVWLNMPVISSDLEFRKVIDAEIISYDPN